MVKAKEYTQEQLNAQAEILQEVQSPNSVYYNEFKDAKGIDAVNKDGEPLIHVAIFRKDEGLIELLIKAGADLNQKSALQETPLQYAVNNNFTRIAQALIKGEADINLTSKMSLTGMQIDILPIEMAHKLGNKELIQSLVAKAKPGSPTDKFAQENYIEREQEKKVEKPSLLKTIMNVVKKFTEKKEVMKERQTEKVGQEYSTSIKSDSKGLSSQVKNKAQGLRKALGVPARAVKAAYNYVRGKQNTQDTGLGSTNSRF